MGIEVSGGAGNFLLEEGGSCSFFLLWPFLLWGWEDDEEALSLSSFFFFWGGGFGSEVAAAAQTTPISGLNRPPRFPPFFKKNRFCRLVRGGRSILHFVPRQEKGSGIYLPSTSKDAAVFKRNPDLTLCY